MVLRARRGDGGLLGSVVAGLLDFLLPRACALCGGPLHGGARDDAICPACLSRLGPPGPILPAPRPLAAAGAAGSFGGPLREAIHLFKYLGRSELAGSLGRQLAAALPAALPGLAAAATGRAVDLVVPVPLHPLRLAARGFNQAALLARPVTGYLGVPLAGRLLLRVRDTPPQPPLGRAARRANVRGAFAVCRPAALRGRRCLLVDDVLTTGATAAACARALLDAGAVRVTLLVLARA